MLILPARPCNERKLQYHKAAHLGKQRAQKAQLKLFDYTGFAMLTYTIKQARAGGAGGFEPVGEEELAAKITRGDKAMLFICDADGYAKAQSKPMPLQQGLEIFAKMLSDGMPEYRGEVKTVS
jgi:hypothetical protein